MIELQNTDTPAVTSATNEKLVIILPAGWDVSNVDIVLVDDDRLDSYVLY